MFIRINAVMAGSPTAMNPDKTGYVRWHRPRWTRIEAKVTEALVCAGC